MLAPKKSKFRKSHKLRRGGKVSRKNHLSFGSYGLKSLSAHWVSARQLEAARRVISRYLTKTGKLWIRVFPDAPVTLKGGEIPMGKGKGSVDHYVAKIKAGTIMFEVDGISEAEAKIAVSAAAHKLPVKCVFVKK
jgi:large subunit ribosomal protein L16